MLALAEFGFIIRQMKLSLPSIITFFKKIAAPFVKLTHFLFIKELTFSSIAMLTTFVLGFLSMGLLGGVLYYLVAPITSLWLPHLNDLSGDWIWPALIGVGMIWGVGFLIAGIIDNKFVKKFANKLIRRLIYGLILWLTAFCLWAFTLYINLPNSQ